MGAAAGFGGAALAVGGCLLLFFVGGSADLVECLDLDWGLGWGLGLDFDLAEAWVALGWDLAMGGEGKDNGRAGCWGEGTWDGARVRVTVCPVGSICRIGGSVVAPC